MNHRAFISLLAGAGLALTAPAFAASGNAQDAMFVKAAAQGGMAEVKLARLALRKSSTPAVVSFARHMRADHTPNNAQLQSIAMAQGYALPASVGPRNAMMMSQLQAANGAAFDAQYLKSQLPAHEKMLALFRREAADGQNSALVTFAKSTIPVIESHIAIDKRDIASIGASVGMR